MPADGGAPIAKPGETIRTRRLLAPTDGARYRRMVLELTAEGGVTLHFHEMGGSEEASWGDDDQEITVRLDARSTARLAFEVIGDALQGREDGVAAFRALCDAIGVEPVVANWT